MFCKEWRKLYSRKARRSQWKLQMQMSLVPEKVSVSDFICLLTALKRFNWYTVYLKCTILSFYICIYQWKYYCSKKINTYPKTPKHIFIPSTTHALCVHPCSKGNHRPAFCYQLSSLYFLFSNFIKVDSQSTYYSSIVWCFSLSKSILWFIQVVCVNS